MILMKCLFNFLLFYFFISSPFLAANPQILGLSSKKNGIANTINGLTTLGVSASLLEFPLQKDHLKGVKILHMDGLDLELGISIEKTMQLAKGMGVKISLALANAKSVDTFRERILVLLEKYTDILFLNEEEANVLTHLPPQGAARFLKNFCPIVVIKARDQGYWVASDRLLFHAPASVGPVTDASDLFASGFLFGYLHHYSLKSCARFGNQVLNDQKKRSISG
jgi:sugar/nucleoside kinase (ribokinase family)